MVDVICYVHNTTSTHTRRQYTHQIPNMASAIGDPTGARAAAAATVAVDASDVTKLVLQWLKESGMTGAMQALVEESGISLNTVDNVDAFVADIKAGQWDRVLTQVKWGRVGTRQATLSHTLLSSLSMVATGGNTQAAASKAHVTV